MLSSRFRSLLLGLVFLVLGSVLVFLGLTWERDRLLAAAVVCFLLSVGALVLGLWLFRLNRDPLERRREQRLWKSGPLGRKWLEDRRRIP